MTIHSVLIGCRPDGREVWRGQSVDDSGFSLFCNPGVCEHNREGKCAGWTSFGSVDRADAYAAYLVAPEQGWPKALDD